MPSSSNRSNDPRETHTGPFEGIGEGADRAAQTDAADGAPAADGSAISQQLLAAAGLTGLERRRGAGRRLSDFGRRAEEGDLTPEQFLFLMAIEEFKRGNGKTYPAWTDVLEVLRLLGYRKTQHSEIVLRNAEDWREAADAPSNVRPQGWERRFRVDEAGHAGKPTPGHSPTKRAA